MLLQIRNYIHRHSIVSLKQLQREFKSDELALQPMLDIWVKKGKIKILEENCTRSCGSCNKKSAIYFAFVG